MVITHKAQGYEDFCELMKSFNADEQLVHVYFSGDKSSTGESWCSDCVRALPIVEAALAKMDNNTHFIYVEVGDRASWKSSDCPFRKDSRTKLMVIPTLVRWMGPQKLEGEQCENPDLVEMLFTDE